jgi:hypothetical protein
MNKPLTKTLYVNGVIVGEVPATGDPDKDMEAMHRFLKEKGLHKQVTKVQAMFRQAISFSTTAAHLYRQDLSNAPRNGLSIAPFVVNSAFSIELYLKTLHELQSTNPGREHHLLKLYDGLLAATRDTVVRHALANGTNYDVRITTADQFRQYVDELDSAFVDWRYCHESGNASRITIQSTILVMKAAHEACKELGAD